MGYRLNRLDEPVLMAVPKPTQTEFDIQHRVESCVCFSCLLSGKSRVVDEENSEKKHICRVKSKKLMRHEKDFI